MEKNKYQKRQEVAENLGSSYNYKKDGVLKLCEYLYGCKVGSYDAGYPNDKAYEDTMKVVLETWDDTDDIFDNKVKDLCNYVMSIEQHE